MSFLSRIFKNKKMEEVKYIPQRDLLKEERYSEEELLALLPAHEYIDRKYAKEAIHFIFDKMPLYQDIWGYMKTALNNSFPTPTDAQYRNREKDSPDYKYCRAYSDYFFGDAYSNFIKCIESEFLHRKGIRRTFEDACDLAADKWVEMIFDTHVQDNGDRSSTAGAFSMMFGTFAKDAARKNCSEKTKENARKLLRDYYLGGCMHLTDGYGKARIVPYSDYGPNTPLREILLKAGVRKDDVNRITPWKTGIRVDENDNTVVVGGYQKQTYI